MKNIQRPYKWIILIYKNGFMTNIILEKWEIKLEIISKPSLLQMDKVLMLFRKYNNYIIWDMEMTLEAAKTLLVDKTKAIEIDEIIKWGFSGDTPKLIEEWWIVIFGLIEKAQEAKKKSTQ